MDARPNAGDWQCVVDPGIETGPIASSTIFNIAPGSQGLGLFHAWSPMICPKCGLSSRVLDTRDAPLLVTKRRRECEAGHRFPTLEIHLSAFHSTTARLCAETIKNRIKTLARDMEAASLAHLNGGRRNLMGEKIGLTKGAFYTAARRGRAHLAAIANRRSKL